MRSRWWALWCNNPSWLRVILALTFAGHALVNLGMSPLIALHQALVGTANHLLSYLGLGPIPVEPFLQGLGIAELIVAAWLLSGRALHILLPVLIVYLLGVGFLAYVLYYLQMQSWLGIAEVMRRLPWIFVAIALWRWVRKRRFEIRWVRLGLAFAFLAHGTASLGLLGFNKGHIDLAVQIVPEEYARDFVFYSGISDTLIGLSLLTGWGVRYMIFPALLWISFVVAISFYYAISDGIFRMGFWLMAWLLLVHLWFCPQSETHTE